MRTIRGAALGTYYAKGADGGRSPNASQMRGLVYAVKDNRQPPNPPQDVAHASHPAYPRPVKVDRTNAIEYVTAILGRRLAKLAQFYGASDPSAITLVPVPSSEVTAATIETARFPTLRLCRALAGAGLGRVAVLAVQREAVTAKTQGIRRSADQILAGLARTDVALPRAGVIVIVDDNVQSGASIAALDQLSAHRDRRPRSPSASPRLQRARMP